MDSYTKIIDDMYSTEYEEVTAGAELFGIPRNLMIQIAIIRELKELNRLLGNWKGGEFYGRN